MKPVLQNEIPVVERIPWQNEPLPMVKQTSPCTSTLVFSNFYRTCQYFCFTHVVGIRQRQSDGQSVFVASRYQLGQHH